VKGDVIPEVGLLVLLLAVAATFGLCWAMEQLLGEYGALPSLMGGLFMGHGARRLARRLSERLQ
jgi:hypothetical protein